MRKLINRTGTALALLLIAGGCTAPKKSEFNIKGEFKGVESGLVKLIRHNDDDRTSTTLDSVELVNGQFALKGKLDHPEMLSIMVTPGNWAFRAFIENGDLQVEADTSGAEHYDFSGYGGEKGANITSFQVKGSESHQLYRSFEENAESKAFKDQLAALNKKYQATEEAAREQVSAQTDSVRQLYLTWELDRITAFIAQHPSSAVGPYLFHNYYIFNTGMPLAKLQAAIETFKEEAKRTSQYQILEKDLNQRLALTPGKVAPDFTLLKPDSTAFTLSSLKGKYVLLDFWASWCVPCRKSIPHWKEIYGKYKDKGLEIVGVTNDSDWSDWRRALDQEKMPWIQVADEFPVKNMPSRVGELYMTPALPSYILLDPDGKIVLHDASKEDITSAIQERLK